MVDRVMLDFAGTGRASISLVLTLRRLLCPQNGLIAKFPISK